MVSISGAQGNRDVRTGSLSGQVYKTPLERWYLETACTFLPLLTYPNPYIFGQRGLPLLFTGSPMCPALFSARLALATAHDVPFALLH